MHGLKNSQKECILKHLDVFKAWLEGAKIEYRLIHNNLKGSWKETPLPAWIEQAEYRVALTKPSINWEHVDKDYNFLSVGSDGRPFLSRSKPLKTSGWIYHGLHCCAKSHSSYKPGTCDWEDSLVTRPSFDEVALAC